MTSDNDMKRCYMLGEQETGKKRHGENGGAGG